MALTEPTEARAVTLRDELKSAARGAQERGAPLVLTARLDLALAAIEHWLKPPGDDGQLRAAVAAAETALKEWGEWRTNGRLPHWLAQTGQKQKDARVTAPGVTIPVHFTADEKLRQFYVRDISAGGVFLRASHVLPVFSQIFFDLTMPDGILIKLLGQVVHVRTPEHATPDRPSGMGVQFLNLTPEIKEQIGRYVERIKKRSSIPANTVPVDVEPAKSTLGYASPGVPMIRLPGLHDERALLRRLLWMVAEGSVLGRPVQEVFGLPSEAPRATRLDIYERMRALVAPDQPPSGLGEEEARAVATLLVQLRSLVDVDG